MNLTLQKMTPVFLSKADLDVALRDADAARKQEQSEKYARTAKKHREEYDAAKKEVLHTSCVSMGGLQPHDVWYCPICV